MPGARPRLWPRLPGFAAASLLLVLALAEDAGAELLVVLGIAWLVTTFFLVRALVRRAHGAGGSGDGGSDGWGGSESGGSGDRGGGDGSSDGGGGGGDGGGGGK